MDDPRPIGAVVGNGRVGRALVAALPHLHGPFGRGFDGRLDDGTLCDAVILAVPDVQVAAAAAAIADGPMVGHCAGSLGLDVLAPHQAFGLHPLMTVTATSAHASTSAFAGAAAAVAGITAAAASFATQLAESLGMRPFPIADRDRAAYHAAASIAANFLVTLEDAAEQLLRTVGADRSVLVPLVRAALENWAALGSPAALTGPIVRGDQATVDRQRAAIAERAPDLLALFDVMCDRTRVIWTASGAPGS